MRLKGLKSANSFSVSFSLFSSLKIEERTVRVCWVLHWDDAGAKARVMDGRIIRGRTS